jgi:hypothetical protein
MTVHLKQYMRQYFCLDERERERERERESGKYMKVTYISSF